jgi:Skp family chaperone for outer membrane proteins
MITVLTVCALIAGASIASAQTTPPPPPTQTPPPQTQKPATPAPTAAPAPVPFPADAKIAFISMQDLVALSDLGKAGSKEMQALTEAKNQQVAAKQKEVTALEAKAQAQASVLSAEAAGNLRRELDRVTRELEFMKQQAQADVELKNQELLTNFSQKVGPIIDAVRTEKGLWVIFAVQQAEGGVLAVAAAHPGVDLTMEVVRRLNAATAGK